MTNWKEEVNSLKTNMERAAANKAAIKAATELQIKQNQEIAYEQERTKFYQEEIIPGFEILDRLKVSETLDEVRSQIWMAGEIIKSPDGFQQFLSKSCFDVDHPFYMLKSPPYIDAYDRSIFDNDESGYYIHEDCDGLSIGIKQNKLYVVPASSDSHYNLNGKCLEEFHHDYYDQDDGISLNRSDNSILSWIKQKIIKDSLDRQDYREIIRPSAYEHPELLERFYKENPEWRQKSKSLKKRSFLDKLFGNE